MIQRRAGQAVVQALRRQAAVALLGARQVGKTTLALEIAGVAHQSISTLGLGRIVRSCRTRPCFSASWRIAS